MDQIRQARRAMWAGKRRWEFQGSRVGVHVHRLWISPPQTCAELVRGWAPVWSTPVGRLTEEQSWLQGVTASAVTLGSSMCFPSFSCSPVCPEYVCVLWASFILGTWQSFSPDTNHLIIPLVKPVGFWVCLQWNKTQGLNLLLNPLWQIGQAPLHRMLHTPQAEPLKMKLLVTLFPSLDGSNSEKDAQTDRQVLVDIR